MPGGGPGPGAPLLPDHPQLLHRYKCGERTVYVSPECPPSMLRSDGRWLLADFSLTRQLYKGKASTLYQATDRVSGGVVALKAYSKRRLSELNWYQVEREIRLHAQLAHPHIIPLHAAFEDSHYVFMVTEFAAGGDLYEDLKRAGGRHSESTVAGEVLPPFMAALAHMHARAIVHRDIKPENILLTADRTIKVADFGLSINCSEERPVTRAGTLDYMSPEVLLCPEKSRPDENKEKFELGYGDAVDVWAAGILAYELLVGSPPFERETREETYACIAKRELGLPPWMSDGAANFITKAMAKNPSKRPTMAQLLQHPWILQHARRTASGAAVDPHLPLLEAAGTAGSSPFGEVHRASLHGAKSCHDFSTLLPASSTGSTCLMGALSPAPSLSAAMGAATAAEATVAATARLTTSHSRLGLAGVAGRPAAPATASALPPPTGFGLSIAQLFAEAAVAVSRPMPASSSSQALPRLCAEGDVQRQDASAADTSACSPGMPAACGKLPAATAVQDGTFASPSSTSLATEPSAVSSQKVQARPPANRGSTLQSPRAAAIGRSGSFGSRHGSPSNSSGNTGSCRKSLEAAALPLLGQPARQEQKAPSPPQQPSLARLPSLHRALSTPQLQMELPPTPADTPAHAAPAASVAAESEPAPLAPIPEQRSSDAEPAALADAGHVMPAAVQHKQQQAEAAADAQIEGEERIPALHAGGGSPACPVASMGHPAEEAQAQAPCPAQQVQHDRMWEAEQRHIAKLRARAAAAAGGGRGTPRGKQQVTASMAAGLTKSASSLLGRLLGRKPANTTPAAAAATAPAQSQPQLKPSPPRIHVSARAGVQPASPRAQQPVAATPTRATSDDKRLRQLPAAGRPGAGSPSAGQHVRTGAAVPSKEAPSAKAVEPTAGSLASSPSHLSLSGSLVRLRTNSKSFHSLRFGGVAEVGPSRPLDAEDRLDSLIPAHRSGSTSFATAASSLPPSSLPSTTASGTSRKGSASPAASRKGSQAVPARAGSSQRSAGRPGGSLANGRSKLRGANVASMPGDKAAAPAVGSAGTSAGSAQVARSPASWSHPAKDSPHRPAGQRKPGSATAARLSMYKVLLGMGKSGGAGTPAAPMPAAARGSKAKR